MKNPFKKFVIFLHHKYGITPNQLSYIRIFAAPWLALFVSMALSDNSMNVVIFTLILYFLVMSTDIFDGMLARAISNTQAHDHSLGGMLDRISDKILIIFLLIPFGLNLFTFSIILGESLLAYQAINSPRDKKGATRTGKLKMVFQTLAIPLLIIFRTTNFIPLYFFVAFQILTIILTYMSVYSHYFGDNETNP